MKTHTYTTYSFDELSEDAQEHALEKCWDWNVQDSFWYEFTIDDAKEIGKILGIEISNIYFSGFSSQGDGACFEGQYSYAKGGLKAIKEYAPQDTELHKIAKDLQDLQKVNFYRLSASVKHSGHYNHEYCTVIDVDDYDSYSVDNATDEALKDILRDFMRWIYSQLRKEYEYLTSEECLKEYFSDSDYLEFHENGNRA